MKKILKYLLNIIAIFLSILTLCGLYLGFRWVNHQLPNVMPNMNYQTIFLKDTTQIKKPDTEVRWLEKIKQVEVKPETVKVVEYVYETPNELVNFIKADGHKIRVRTQQCGSAFGKELTYPYYKYYQFVPPNSMIYYRDYWDWDKLNLAISYDLTGQTQFKLYSSLQFNPWGLMIQPYVSTVGTGIEIRKKFW